MPGLSDPVLELAVVVLSRGEPQLPTALASLMRQSEAAEIVVSHSGPPTGLDPALEQYPDLRFDASVHRRMPGGARNAGVRATSAPWVAFLAADCEALPGWVAGRIRRHRAGAVAVASAMAAPQGAPAALAAHLLQHSARMPHVCSAPHLRFGVSYSRDALEHHGGFDERLPVAEDVAMNAQLIAKGVVPDLAPEVLTVHAYPASMRTLVRDARRRGRLRWSVRGAHRPRGVLAARVLADAPAGALRAAAPGSGISASRLAATLPYLAAGGTAAAAGVLTGGPRPRSV